MILLLLFLSLLFFWTFFLICFHYLHGFILLSVLRVVPPHAFIFMLAEASQVVVAWYVLHVFVMMAVPACLVVHTTRIRALLEPLREAIILLSDGGDVLLELDVEVGGILEVLVLEVWNK